MADAQALATALMNSAAHGPVMRPYEPTWRDKVASFLMGDGKTSQGHQNFVEGLMGSRGLGTTGMGLVDLTPAGIPMAVQEGRNDLDQGNYVRGVLGVASVVPGARIGVSAADLLASRSAFLYNPPRKAPRPFEADYPNGAQADRFGNLTNDIEGRPLTAPIVVGRRVVGGADEAISPAEFDAIGKATTGRSTQIASIPGNDVGRVTLTDPYSRRPKDIILSNKLNPDQLPNVYGHEIGHAIDQAVGEIPIEGVNRQAAQVYNTLNTGAERSRNLTGPQHYGYGEKDVPRELMAEGIRAYMSDPNYIKTVAPSLAARIRKVVNSHPELSKAVQFNSITGLLSLPAARMMATPPEGEK